MNPFEHMTEFCNKDNIEHRFIKVINDRVLIWKKVKDHEYACSELDYETVNEEILTKAGVWNDLTSKIQERIQEAQSKKKNETVKRMAIAREKRKKKYDFSHFPEFLKCKCGREVKANYYYLQKKADEKKIPLDDLVKNYVCQICSPTKGRKKK